MKTLDNIFKNTFINTLITTKLGLDTLPVRLGAGVIFAAHGAQKLFGWFGGYGLEGTAGWMESIGLAPGTLMAALAGGAEFFGGLLLIAGFLVRPSAVVLAITMLHPKGINNVIILNLKQTGLAEDISHSSA